MSSGDRLKPEELGKLVKAERRRRGISLREASAEIGIPFNTLARVEKGQLPDLRKFKALADWLKIPIARFLGGPSPAIASTPEMVAQHLLLDPQLSRESATEIAAVVREMYDRLTQSGPVLAVHLRSAKTFKPAAAAVLGELLSDMDAALAKSRRVR